MLQFRDCGRAAAQMQMYRAVAAAGIAALGLSGCANQVDTIAADNAILCQYSSADALGSNPRLYRQCISRLEGQKTSLVAANATRIEGYALLAPGTPTSVAKRCDPPDPAKDCPAGDVTGTIPTPQPKP